MYRSTISALVGSKWSALRPGCFTFGERPRDIHRIVAGRAPDPVWATWRNGMIRTHGSSVPAVQDCMRVHIKLTSIYWYMRRSLENFSLPHLVCSWSELAHGLCWSPPPSCQRVVPQVTMGGSGECCRCPRHWWSQPRDLARFILMSVAFSSSSSLITGVAQQSLLTFNRLHLGFPLLYKYVS